MRISSTAFLVGATLAATGASPALTQEPPPTPRSVCMGLSCEAMRRGELFVATFGKSGDTPGLRTSNLEMEAEVSLAYFGIDATRREVEAGKITQSEGDSAISGFEDTIRWHLRQAGGTAYVLAGTGELADIPEIARRLGPILGVARQDALLGREELAGEAQLMLVGILVTFSEKFSETCDKQIYKPEIALGLERQNSMLGTEVSVFHCARRKYTADLTSQGINYHLETCAIDEKDDWTLQITGKATGSGNAARNVWRAEAEYQGRKYNPTGTLEILAQAVVVKEAPAVVPDDAGPGAKPNGRPIAPVPPERWYPSVKMIEKVRMTTIYLRGEHGISGWTSHDDDGHWAEAAIGLSDKPCSEKG